jgi:murein endopeptidase
MKCSGFMGRLGLSLVAAAVSGFGGFWLGASTAGGADTAGALGHPPTPSSDAREELESGHSLVDTAVVVASEPTPTDEEQVDPRHILLEQTEEDLGNLARRDPEALGSLSLGRVNRGGLFNPVELPDSPLWHRVEPDKAFGTLETVLGLTRAVQRVHRAFPDAHELWVGHISGPRGGWLKPHRSHQSGRDVDLGFYYLDDSRWYVRASADNLDLPRTWALLRALVEVGDVEMIFLDRGVQALLSSHAASTGVDEAWLDEVFEGTRQKTQCIVRHAWGHATHMHVRFRSEVSQALASRTHAELVQAGHLPRGRRYH